MKNTATAEIVIVGGGVAGSLAALRILEARPETKLYFIEVGEERRATWGFLDSDLNREAFEWLKPMIHHSWEKTTVRFPRFEKTTEGRFHALRTSALEDALKAAEKKAAAFKILSGKIDRLTEDQAVLENGDVITAQLVLDARPLPADSSRLAGYRKSVALDFVLESPHGLDVPVLIDATCPQLDGFRCFSLLPWNERSLRIEEIFLSDSTELKNKRIVRSIEAFAERKGWKIASREGEETSCQIMPMTADYVAMSGEGEALAIGLRGGYFHALTGNPFPDAVKIAEFLAAQIIAKPAKGKAETASPASVPSTEKMREALQKYRRPWASRQSFYRLINRFLFYASEPSLRYQILQQIYEQPQDVVARLTACRSTWGDRLRLLSARPAIPLDRALKSFSERAIQAHVAGGSGTKSLST